jgi:hypothetical protein
MPPTSEGALPIVTTQILPLLSTDGGSTRERGVVYITLALCFHVLGV